MKLSKPVISICIIVIIVVDLIFFSFFCIVSKAQDKEFVNEVVSKFDVKKYLLDNDNIRYSINNYKYSENVFDYLDELKIKLVKKKFVDNLFDGNEELIDKKLVVDLLNSSVYEYEYKNKEDIYNYVSKDIDAFSNSLVKMFDKEFSKNYRDFSNVSGGILYYVSIIVAIILFALIIIIEKKTGILISGITLLLYSFFLYYFNKHFLEIGFNSVFKYFNNIDLHLDNTYVICFIFSFVLLLIYMIIYLKKVFRNIRVNSYYRR